MTWFDTYRGLAHAWQCDHFGHLNVRYYSHFFDDAGFVLWSLSGVTKAFFEEKAINTVVARTECDLRREVLAGELLAVRSQWVSVGTKSVTYVQELRGLDDDSLRAVQRVVEVCFDPKTRQSTSWPAELRALLSPHLPAEETAAG